MAIQKTTRVVLGKMEFYSPQPEHAQLNGTVIPKNGSGSTLASGSASGLWALLHQQVVQSTHDNDNDEDDDGQGGNIDTVLEEHVIPSPPLSPLLTHIDDKGCGEHEHGDDDLGGIVVKASWSPGLSPETYRRTLHDFLKEYRVFHRREVGSNRRVTSGVAAGNGAEGGRIYRTRKRQRDNLRIVSEDDVQDFEFVRPSTPVRSRRIPPCVSSPLASANAVHTTPNYVPNMSWEKLPDYSPPLSTLPVDNTKCLKVEWKGSPMDLSNDPLRDMLHPAELALAQILRLPCDLYLDSKRRLFLEKTHRLKQGLPFRRTDAQKACRIDVNKASRLYAAFEKVGWLKDSNFTRFL